MLSVAERDGSHHIYLIKFVILQLKGQVYILQSS